uniref:MFS domain-containing protein n=1 Tax=Macrostomum lignano TaxID=282301 RepID=A0A1I8IZL9_9PLAT
PNNILIGRALLPVSAVGRQAVGGNRFAQPGIGRAKLIGQGRQRRFERLRLDRAVLRLVVAWFGSDPFESGQNLGHSRPHTRPSGQLGLQAELALAGQSLQAVQIGRAPAGFAAAVRILIGFAFLLLLLLRFLLLLRVFSSSLSSSSAIAGHVLGRRGVKHRFYNPRRSSAAAAASSSAFAIAEFHIGTSCISFSSSWRLVNHYRSWAPKGEVCSAVKAAIDVGYRHIDCAAAYGNEDEVGDAIAAKLSEGAVCREDLFVTSKLWNTYHRPDLVKVACKKSLENLKLSYLDLYLIHWPMAYVEDREFFPKDENGKFIFSEVDYLDTWKAMEQLVDEGLAKAVGVSNFNSEQLGRILANCRIPPACLQIESSPYFVNGRLIDFAQRAGITVVAYSPLGSPKRPWAKPGDPQLLDEPLLKAIGAKYGKSPAQVVLRFQLERNVGVVPNDEAPSDERPLISDDAASVVAGKDGDVDIETALDQAGYGRLHLAVMSLCAWACTSDAVEIVCVSFILPAAECDLGLTSFDKGALNAVIFAGMLVGGLLWGAAGDAVGRRATLIWSLTVNATGGLASCLAPNFWTFLALRFLSGLGVGGSYPVIFSYYSEWQSRRRRGAAVAALSCCWMLGGLITAAGAWLVVPRPGWTPFNLFGGSVPFHSWRLFVALCSLPSLTSAALFPCVPESPKYLLQ